MYFGRLIATLGVAAALIGIIIAPTAPSKFAAGVARLAPEPPTLANASCPTTDDIFAVAFADVADVVSVTPLGGVTAPGEPLPAPFIRINTKRGATAFDRRQTAVLAPARADLVAIERQIVRDDAGEATGQSWTAHFVACKDVAFQIGDLDAFDTDLIRRAGGVAAFREVSGPDHTAVRTRIRLQPGATIGAADGFDVAITDQRVVAQDLVRPERYRSNPYVEARVYDTPPDLLKAIAFDHTKARCPLAYLPPALEAEWSELLGGDFGMRKAKGENACRAAVIDTPGTAQGAWFTDAANNGVAAKISAIALAPDAVDPRRQILALHGRLKSLTPSMVALTPKQTSAREAASKDFLTFEASKVSEEEAGVMLVNATTAGDAMAAYVNRPFARTTPGAIYCYEGLRANFVGPRINGVVLLQVAADHAEDAAGATMKMEARDDAQSCADLTQPWAFSDRATTFYR
ncbi:MAG: hypothetical protein GC152_00285 [Alphaproteobacteria bacterium]|nr:hypothetical protein [Alphaproteobacteria bacterium]